MPRYRLQNESVLRERTDAYVGDEKGDLALRIYEALGRCKGAYEAWGLEPPTDLTEWQDPLKVLRHIEDTYYDTSRTAFALFYKIQPS